MQSPTKIRLTALAAFAGCAAKIGPGDLATVLQPLKATFNPADFPDLLVGLAIADDAAVYRLNSQQAIVSTVDFFPPIVDDPYDFGAIAAANALSDIYAMGGRVLFAINLVAFPDDLDKAILQQILQGGADKVVEAGGVVAGGHSVKDSEPKYGLAVTGLIDPNLVKTKGGGRPGDWLVLTKPLGVGLITTALKRSVAKDAHVKAAVTSMKLLNRQAAVAAQQANAHAVTDITGFGLLGHAHEMALAGHVNFQFDFDRLPWLAGAFTYAQADVFPGGTAVNRQYFAPWVTFAEAISPLMQKMLWTPETSGGLLVALAPDAVATYQTHCPAAVVVGQVVAGNGAIEVV
jgi:selenide,water dikinase